MSFSHDSPPAAGHSGSPCVAATFLLFFRLARALRFGGTSLSGTIILMLKIGTPFAAATAKQSSVTPIGANEVPAKTTACARQHVAEANHNQRVASSAALDVMRGAWARR